MLGSPTKPCPGRRDFLRLTGASVAGASVAGAAIAVPTLAGCAVLGRVGSRTLDFNSDFGVLNYAYALEVLESDFYRRVVADPPADLRPGELDVLRGISAHEDAHRTFFARALNVFRISVPDRDFSAVDFTSRKSVLTTARRFEDTGVAAYNGAGKYLSLPEFLTIAGKIVSVEARHAATIRELLFDDARAFAGDDVVDEFGLDAVADPAAVVDLVAPYFTERLRVVGV